MRFHEVDQDVPTPPVIAYLYVLGLLPGVIKAFLDWVIPLKFALQRLPQISTSIKETYLLVGCGSNRTPFCTKIESQRLLAADAPLLKRRVLLSSGEGVKAYWRQATPSWRLWPMETLGFGEVLIRVSPIPELNIRDLGKSIRVSAVTRDVHFKLSSRCYSGDPKYGRWFLDRWVR
jgi:hypothetical protein